MVAYVIYKKKGEEYNQYNPISNSTNSNRNEATCTGVRVEGKPR